MEQFYFCMLFYFIELMDDYTLFYKQHLAYVRVLMTLYD